jgi:hypothetical protein
VLISLGELQKNHFLVLLVNIIQQAVGTDTKAVLRGELRQNELAGELFHPFPIWPGIDLEGSHGRNNGFLIFCGNLGEYFLEGALDSFAGKDDFVAQLESHVFEESFGGNHLPLRIFRSGSGNLSQQFPILQLIKRLD